MCLTQPNSVNFMKDSKVGDTKSTDWGAEGKTDGGGRISQSPENEAVK